MNRVTDFARKYRPAWPVRKSLLWPPREWRRGQRGHKRNKIGGPAVMTVLRRQGVWLVLAALAGCAGAWVVQASLPARYTSTAQVDVEPRLEPALAPVLPNMGTEEQVAISGVVLASTARTLHTAPLKLVKDLSTSVSGAGTGATAAGTANVLTIGCTMPTATAARQCAAAVTAGYLAFRNMEGKPAKVRSHDPIQVVLITPATVPAAPSGPTLAILLPIGALLGLTLGFGGIFLRDHSDHRVRDRGDLERCLDAPVLAAVPRIRRLPGHAALTVCHDPLSPAAEAYRYLREHLGPLISSVPGSAAVVLVAGAQTSEGRTAVAANLATTLAEAGASVILVDASLRRPALSDIFVTGERPGFADLLAGGTTVAEVAVPVGDVPGLRLVTAGHAAEPSARLLQLPRVTRAFQELRAEADVVVVDSAPLLVSAQALTLARSADIVAIVANVRLTEREAVRAAAQQIRVIGPAVIFGVVNGVPATRDGQVGSSARTPEPQRPARAASVPEVLAGVTQPGGPNGQRPVAPAAPGQDAGGNPG